MSDRDHAIHGNAWVNDTNPHAVSFYGFSVYEDTVLTAITVDDKDVDVTSSGGHGNIVGATLKQGYYPIAGTSIQRDSGGNILLHKRAV